MNTLKEYYKPLISLISLLLTSSFINAQQLNNESNINFLIDNFHPEKVFSKQLADEEGQDMELILYKDPIVKEISCVRRIYLDKNNKHSWSFYFYKNKLIKVSDLRVRSTSQFYYYYQDKVFSIIPSSKVENENIHLVKYSKSLLELAEKYSKYMNKNYAFHSSNQEIWIKEFKRALSKAKQEGKLILLCYLDDSDISNDFETKIIESEEFIEYAKENKLVLCEPSINETYPRGKLGIHDYPTLVLINTDPEKSEFYYSTYGFDESISTNEITEGIKKAVSEYTPISDPFLAAKNGDIDLLTYSLKQNIDINKIKSNKTLAMFAAEHGHEEMIRFLHEKGADLTLKNKKGMTAEKYAEAKGYRKLSELIKELQ